MNVDELRPKLEPILSARPVRLAYLFGSHAVGRARSDSDIDVAVLLDDALSADERFEQRLDLIGEFQTLFRTDDVDVVILNEAAPLLAFEVLRNGKLLYCRIRAKESSFRCELSASMKTPRRCGNCSPRSWSNASETGHLGSRSESVTIRRSLICGFALATMMVASLGRYSGGYHCVHCGRLRGESAMTICGVPLARQSGETDSEFTRLYAQFVSGPCKHSWRLNSEGCDSGLFRWGSCPRMPYVLLRRDETAKSLRLLSCLHDRARATRVMKSINLNYPSRTFGDLNRLRIEAVAKVENVASKDEEEAWWKKNQRLFVKRDERAEMKLAFDLISD